MGRGGVWLLAIAVTAGCGSASHRNGPGARTSSGRSGETTSVHSQSALAGLANRTLVAGELRGFTTLPAVVVSNPRKWVATGEWNSGRRGQVLTRLRRLGFVAAARDDLVSATTAAAGVSIVEKFGTSSSARAEIVAELRAMGRGQGFANPAVPDAHGIRLRGSNSLVYTAAFAAGPYFYLIRVRWREGTHPPANPAIVISAMQRLYGRVTES